MVCEVNCLEMPVSLRFAAVSVYNCSQHYASLATAFQQYKASKRCRGCQLEAVNNWQLYILAQPSPAQRPPGRLTTGGSRGGPT